MFALNPPLNVTPPATAVLIAACISAPVAKVLDAKDTPPDTFGVATTLPVYGPVPVPVIVNKFAFVVFKSETPVTGAAVHSTPALPPPKDFNNCPAVPVFPLISIKSLSNSNVPVTFDALPNVISVPVSVMLESVSVSESVSYTHLRAHET